MDEETQIAVIFIAVNEGIGKEISKLRAREQSGYWGDYCLKYICRKAVGEDAVILKCLRDIVFSAGRSVSNTSSPDFKLALD